MTLPDVLLDELHEVRCGHELRALLRELMATLPEETRAKVVRVVLLVREDEGERLRRIVARYVRRA